MAKFFMVVRNLFDDFEKALKDVGYSKDVE
jgi:hypothetical protein